MASFWAAFGLPFGSLWLLLATIGPYLGPPWLPFWTFRTPSRAFSAPWTDFGGVFPHPGPPLGPLLASFGCFWAPLGLSLDPLGPHFGRPTFELIGLSWLDYRLTNAGEFLPNPSESSEIVLSLLKATAIVIFFKVSNCRLPQQAEFKKQGGRRCVARRASSIKRGHPPTSRRTRDRCAHN